MKQPAILIVDDDVNFTASLKRSLRSLPLKVMTCNDALQAIAILRAGEVDVLVTDQQMPHLHGTQLVQFVDKHFPDIPRIMLSGKLEFEVAQQAINYGRINRFISKPCEIGELVGAIGDCLRIRENSQLVDSLERLVEMQAAFIDSIENDDEF